MDWNEFLNALLSYEVIDNRNKKKKETSRAQLKAEKKQVHDIKIKKKRKSTDADDTTSEKKRPHKNCTYCVKRKKGKHWTNNDDECGHKKREEGVSSGRPKENHMQETSMKELLSICKSNQK